MKKTLALLGGVAVALATAPALAATEIHWWHAMQGELGREVERLASDFNASQSAKPCIVNTHEMNNLVAYRPNRVIDRMCELFLR